MYSLDGVALANPTYGWRFKRASEPWIGRSLDRPDLNASNRDGTVKVRGHVTTPTFPLTVTAPGESVEALRRLMRLGATLTRTADPSVYLDVQMVSMSHSTLLPSAADGTGGLHQVACVYRAPGVWWRDVATTDYSAVVPMGSGGAGSASMSVLTGSTGAVQDAVIVAKGDLTDLRLAGRNSTYVQIAGQWPYGDGLRIDTAKGRAWSCSLTTADVWTDTQHEITDQLQTGAYPYFLELFPPSTGAAASTLTLTWSAATKDTTVIVRAANAYDR